MKTVSTKLDNKLHDRFIEICNEDGKCQSEFLRDLIETVCEDCSDEDNLPLTSKEPKEILMLFGLFWWCYDGFLTRF